MVDGTEKGVAVIASVEASCETLSAELMSSVGKDEDEDSSAGMSACMLSVLDVDVWRRIKRHTSRAVLSGVKSATLPLTTCSYAHRPLIGVGSTISTPRLPISLRRPR